MSENAKKPSILEETLNSIKDVKDALMETTNNAFGKTSLRDELEKVLSEQTVTVNEAEEDGDNEDAIGSTEDIGSELTTDTPDLDASEEGDAEPASVETADEMEPPVVPAVGDDTEEVMDLTNSSDEEALEVFKKLGPEDKIEVVQNDNGEIEITTQDGAEFIAKPNEGGEEVVDADIAPADSSELDAAMDDATTDVDIEGGDATEMPTDVETSDVEEPAGEDAPEIGGDETEGDDEEEIVFEFDLNETSETVAEETVAEENVSEETVAEEAPAEEAEVSEEVVAEGATKANNNVDWEAKYNALNEKHTNTVSELKEFRGKYTKLVQEQSQLNKNVETLNESVSAYKQNEAEYKQSLDKLKSTLNEISVFTANTTNALNLMMENSTTKEEKANILKQFDGVSTVNESNRVYNNLNESFKSINKKTAEQILSESTRSVKSGASETSALKEKTVFKDKSLNEHLDAMKSIITYKS